MKVLFPDPVMPMSMMNPASSLYKSQFVLDLELFYGQEWELTFR